MPSWLNKSSTTTAIKGWFRLYNCAEYKLKPSATQFIIAFLFNYLRHCENIMDILRCISEFSRETLEIIQRVNMCLLHTLFFPWKKVRRRGGDRADCMLDLLLLIAEAHRFKLLIPTEIADFSFKSNDNRNYHFIYKISYSILLDYHYGYLNHLFLSFTSYVHLYHSLLNKPLILWLQMLTNKRSTPQLVWLPPQIKCHRRLP